LLITIY